jgi:NTP pyrophosphatase (non-canonical NTP hydrolase)
MFAIELDVAADCMDVVEIAAAYDVDVTLVNPNGPGGGNPVYEFVATSRRNLVDFLTNEYGDDDGYFASFINEIPEEYQVQEEIMAITQEECAEVIQALSKVMRFGLNTSHNGRTNRAHLEEEVGDLMCMFQLMDEYDMVDWSKVSLAASAKRKKLQKWSNIFGNSNSTKADDVEHSSYYFDTDRNL